MKNLESFNVHELSTAELRRIQGGWIRFVVGVLTAVAKEVIGDWDNFKAGMNGEDPIIDN